MFQYEDITVTVALTKSIGRPKEFGGGCETWWFLVKQILFIEWKHQQIQGLKQNSYEGVIDLVKKSYKAALINLKDSVKLICIE